MTIQKMFEVATRSKMRFPFKGLISVEDLWDLSVQNLDAIYKVLNSEKKQASEDSLLQIKTKENETLEMKIAIVKHIVSVKLEEENARTQAQEKKVLKQRLLEIKAAKRNESLQNKSEEEIDAMITELDS